MPARTTPRERRRMKSEAPPLTFKELDMRRHTMSLATLTVLTGLALSGVATPATARPEVGPHPDQPQTFPAAPPSVGRIGRQIVRCDTGEGNLGGAGVTAPATLPNITTCVPASWVVPAVSAAAARQLEHDLLR